MTKKILLLGLFSSFSMFSQIREKGAIEVSPFVGYISSNFYGDVGIVNYGTDNVYFGANVDYFFNNRWSIRSGLEYQGMGNEGGWFFFENNNIQKLNFIGLPIHANWHFGSTRKWYLNFGPTLNFLTSAKLNNVVNTSIINQVQVGLGYGIGYKFFINEKISIAIDHQEYIGFSNNIKSSPNNSFVGNYFGTLSVKGVFVF